MPQLPTPGRTVLYTLSADDADAVNRRREDYTSAAKHTRTGFIGHIGNKAFEGDQYPATVVRVWGEPHPSVNLQVHLDGNDVYWATSRTEGETAGQWAWPERTP